MKNLILFMAMMLSVIAYAAVDTVKVSDSSVTNQVVPVRVEVDQEVKSDSIGDMKVVYSVDKGTDTDISGAIDIAKQLINYLVLLIAAVISFFINQTIDSDSAFINGFSNFMKKWLPRGLRTAIITVITSLAYMWAWGVGSRVEIFGLVIVTPLATVAAMSMGGSKLMSSIISIAMKMKS